MTPTWPCGHKRTPANTRLVGKAGVRCRECRREIDRRYHARAAIARATKQGEVG